MVFVVTDARIPSHGWHSTDYNERLKNSVHLGDQNNISSTNLPYLGDLLRLMRHYNAQFASIFKYLVKIRI